MCPDIVLLHPEDTLHIRKTKPSTDTYTYKEHLFVPYSPNKFFYEFS